MLSSCSKDVQSAQKLSGIWSITSFTVNSTELISTNTKMETTFTDIAGSLGRYNTKTYVFNILANEVSGDFDVSNNGQSITLDEDGSNAPGTGTIIELSDSFLQITYVDEDGNNAVFKATKK